MSEIMEVRRKRTSRMENSMRALQVSPATLPFLSASSLWIIQYSESLPTPRSVVVVVTSGITPAPFSPGELASVDGDWEEASWSIVFGVLSIPFSAEAQVSLASEGIVEREGADDPEYGDCQAVELLDVIAPGSFSRRTMILSRESSRTRVSRDCILARLYAL